MSWRSLRQFPWLNLALFILTIITTLLAGAAMAGVASSDPWVVWQAGWTFSIPLILALGTHEMGHFVVARMHGLFPSWPYFIPAPTFVGTFGAVIRMKFDRAPTREQLFDVGIAGPLAGFVVSVLLLVIGSALSTIDPRAANLETFSLADGILHWYASGQTDVLSKALNGPYLLLGDSVLVKFVVYAVTGSPSSIVNLHPIGFAGWVGLFVTTLNLLPIGQLDGGHVAVALLGKRFRFMPYFVLPALVVLGFIGWPGWLVWAILISFLGLRHPPAGGEPLGRGRMALAWLCLVIFVLIFTPAPIQPAW